VITNVLDIFKYLYRRNVEERDYLNDVVADGRKTLKLLSNKWDSMAWNGFIRLKKEVRAGIAQSI
jgi:hypothetical protein